MAKAYLPPTTFEQDPPEFAAFFTDQFDFDGYHKACDEYEKDLSDYVRDHFPGELSGEIVRFGVADGKASYVIGRQGRAVLLILIQTGDAYDLPDAHIRGLRLADLRQNVRGQKKMAELFGSRS